MLYINFLWQFEKLEQCELVESGKSLTVRLGASARDKTVWMRIATSSV